MDVLEKQMSDSENQNKCFDGMTNGEVLQALFPNLNIVGTTDKKEFFALDLPKVKEWWNAPYQKGGEE